MLHRSGIGDLVWHIPYLRAIAERSADGRITLLARPSSKAPDVLAGENFVEQIIEFDRKPRASEGRKGRDDSLIAQFALARRLRAQRFARVYIFSSRMRYAVLALLAGIPERAGFGFGLSERIFLNHPPFIARHRGDGNWVYPEATAFAVAHGFAPGPLLPRMAVRADALAEMTNLLAHLPRPRYALAIGSSEPRKHWGSDRFGDLASHLASRGCGIVLLGGPAEAGVAAAIMAHVPAAFRAQIYALTQPSIQRTAGALRQCDFCVGNDTGVLNMAAANEVPALGLFGSTPCLSHDPLVSGIEAESMAAIEVDAVCARLTSLAAPGPSLTESAAS